MQPLLAMFGAGPWELIIVLLVILLLFGNRLPSLMRSMGRGVVEFKKGVNDVDDAEQEQDGSKPKVEKQSN